MATQMKTTTPYRDQAISQLSGVVEEAMDDLNAKCYDDAKFPEGWCDRCTEIRVRQEDAQAVIRKLEDAEDDDAARSIMSAMFWRDVATTGIGTAA